MLLIVAHLVACLFFSSASWNIDYSDPDSINWVRKYGYINSSLEVQYRISIYWAFTVMTTIGFGDFVAITVTERCIAVVSMLLGAGTYGFLIASVTNIVAELNSQKEAYNRRLHELNQYMDNRQLPRDLRVRVRQYYKYFLSRKVIHSEHDIMFEISSHLRSEVYLNVVQRTMQDVPFLSNRKSETIASLMEKLKPTYFPPEEKVVSEGELGTEMYIITEGSACVFSTRTNGPDLCDGLPIAQLKKGDIFGEMAIVMEHKNQTRCATVITLTYCDMYYINKDALLEEMLDSEDLLSDIVKLAWEREKKLLELIRQYEYLLQTRELNASMLNLSCHFCHSSLINTNM